MITKTDIFLRARQIVGNKIGRSAAEQDVPDEAIEAELKTAVRDLNAANPGSALRDVTFTATAGVQDYLIVTYVGDDVYKIQDVWRGGAFTPDYLLDDSEPRLDPRVSSSAATVIHPGLQADVFRTIIQQQRADRFDRLGGWEEAPGGKLRLMPPPVDAEIIAVRYVATGYAISDLPASAEQALVYAACVCLLNGMINRIGGDKVSVEVQRLGTTDQRIKLLEKQRDYYEQKYQDELARAR